MVKIVFIILILFKMDLSTANQMIKINALNGVCDGYPQNGTRFIDVKLTAVKRTYTISFKIINPKTYHNDIKVKFIPYRCQSKDALDTCEKFRDVNIKHFCRVMTEDNMPWSQILQQVKPRLKCPLVKGNHTLTNGIIDLSVLSIWPLGNSYWKAKIVSRDEVTDEFIMCLYVEGQFIH